MIRIGRFRLGLSPFIVAWVEYDWLDSSIIQVLGKLPWGSFIDVIELWQLVLTVQEPAPKRLKIRKVLRRCERLVAHGLIQAGPLKRSKAVPYSGVPTYCSRLRRSPLQVEPREVEK